MATFSDFKILNSNRDFRRLYSRGRSYANPALVTYIKRNSAGICRIGITSSKKIGNAVQRNRSKRLIRAAFREVYKENSEKLKGYDIIFVARVKTRYKKSYEIEKVMLQHLEKAGVL